MQTRTDSPAPTPVPTFASRLGQEVLVFDGAMGTMLHAGGVSLDLPLPELSLSRPELVRAIHSAYIEAGANIVETNTFSACRPRLARHGLGDRVVEINTASVRVAREARDASGKPVLIAGSIGPATPTGFRGRLLPDELHAAFVEQITALANAGVDLLVFETFSSLSDLTTAIKAAKEVCDLPIVAQMTFVEDGRTLGGDAPDEVATTLEALGVAVIGANCTLGPQGLLDVLRELGRHTSLPLCAQPNAGPPTLVEGRFQYMADPPYFGRHARRFVELGAALVGGCCGTTPAHIEAASAAVDGLTPPVRRGPRPATAQTGTHGHLGAATGGSPLTDKLSTGKFVVACEIRPPVGGAADSALRDAQLLKDAGCDAVVIGPPTSTRAQLSPASLALLVQQRVGVEPILTVTTWEKSVITLQGDLLGAHAFGLQHVVCRTGTPPLQGDYPNVAGVWDVDSVGLIEMLKGMNEGRDHNGIPLGRPTSFVVGARLNPSADNFAREVATARRKIEAGATFLITQPVYELDSLNRMLDAIDAPDSVSILLGLMPLQDFRHAEYLQHEVPEMSVPETILERMWRAGDGAPELGLELASELAVGARGRVRGLVVSSGSGSATEMAQLLRGLPE